MARDFLARDLVDRRCYLSITRAIGETPLPVRWAAGLQGIAATKPIVRQAEFGEDVMTAYALREG